MKMRKIFAGMAASAIALSAFAMSASALDAPANAGIAFQMNDTWNYRDLAGTDGSRAVFPQQEVAIQGGAYGISTDVAISDVSIQYDGTYTVSIATSGTITEAHPDKTGTDNGFIVNEDLGLTRQGSKWSMLHNWDSDPNASGDDSKEITQEEYIASLIPGKDASKINMLCIATDIPCEYNDDDQPVVNGEVVKVTDIKVDICGTSYEAAGDVYYKSDTDYLAIALINTYGDSTIDAAAMPTEDGTITATFTIEGLGKDPNAGGDSSTADSATSSTTSSGSSNSGTNNNNNTNKNNNGGTTASKAPTTSATDSKPSDATANAEAGAPAGIALALAAVAGAAIVVSRKK